MSSWICDGVPKDGKQYPNLYKSHKEYKNFEKYCLVCGLPKEAMMPTIKSSQGNETQIRGWKAKNKILSKVQGISEQGEIKQNVTEAEYAATSAAGDAIITITNYYYREEAEVAPAESADAADKALPCPYRGLFHFGPDDAEFFFGREVFVEKLFAATQTLNFIPVLGASGSGKSSVVLAGLVPKLQKEEKWLFTHFRPGSEPFYALAEALVPLYEPNKNSTEQMYQARQLAEYFIQGTVSLKDVFSKIKLRHPNNRILLIADQLEELYTLCDNQKTRNSFLDSLLANFQSFSDNSNVLVSTMRADFLANGLSYRPFADVLQNNDIKLGSMNHDELLEVIKKPADKLGLCFESGLVKRILDDVENEPGNLPLLEFALTELWTRRKGRYLTHEAYQDIGAVQGALARHADKNYQKLNMIERKQVRRIFIQLVNPGKGTEDTRRIANKEELGKDSWPLVKKLADNRLVVTSRNNADQETVEIVHEALIRNWHLMQEWMKEDRNFRAWQEWLRAVISQWQQTKQDEGALLRGLALVEAKEKFKKRSDDLGQSEQYFIKASIALENKEKKQEESRKRNFIFGLTGGLGVALSLAAFAGISWRNAEINEIKSLSKLSDGILFLDLRDVLESNLKAAIKIKKNFLVDKKTRTETKLALVNTVHNIAAPNTLGGHGNSVYSVTFNSDGKILASASADNTVKLWDINTGQEIKTLIGHEMEVWDVAFSPDGKMLASASGDNTVKLWDINTAQEIKTLAGHENVVSSNSFSPDGKILASASADNTVKLWDIDTGKEIKTLAGHITPVYGVSFSPNGKILASADYNHTVKLWDINSGQEIKTLQEIEKENLNVYTNSNTYNEVKFNHDGTILASNSVNNTVKLWNVRTGQEIKTLAGHITPVYGVSFSPDSKVLATAGYDFTVKLWDVRTGQEIKTLAGHITQVYGISFSPDGKILASASLDKTIKLWNVRNNQEIKTLQELKTSEKHKILKKVKNFGYNSEEIWLTKLNFSPDGKILASTDDERSIKLWNIKTGQKIKTLTGHQDTVSNIDFSPDGKMLASASYDKTIKLWNVNTGQEIKTLAGHRNGIYGISFSPDGKMLASAGGDKTIKLWNINTGQEINSLRGHQRIAYDVKFSPDGKMLASAGGDWVVRLWDISTGQEIKRLTGHQNSLNSVSFSPDGKMLASAGDDWVVRLWKLDSDYLVEKGCNFLLNSFKNNQANNERYLHLCAH